MIEMTTSRIDHLRADVIGIRFNILAQRANIATFHNIARGRIDNFVNVVHISVMVFLNRPKLRRGATRCDARECDKQLVGNVTSLEHSSKNTTQHNIPNDGSASSNYRCTVRVHRMHTASREA